MYNKIQLIGRLGKYPETTDFGDDKKVVRFSLATYEKFKDAAGESREKVQWHNVVVWNKLGGVAAAYAKKGDKLFVEGKVEYREYELDGVKKYITEVIATSLVLLEGKGSGSGQDGAPPPPPPPPPDNELPF